MTRRVIYTAQGHRNISEKDIRGMNRDTPIQPGNSSSWKSFPLSIPNIEPSITTCSIIELRYVLKVQAVISGTINEQLIKMQCFARNGYKSTQSVSDLILR